MSKTNFVQHRANHHATVVELDGYGIMIEGKSGAGKTSLALGLIEYFKTAGKAACLISDDQALLEVRNENTKQALVAHRPDAIAGKVEIRGFGISKITSKASCEIDLVVELVPDEKIERMPDEKYCLRRDVRLPCIEVPERHEAQSVRIVVAKMKSVFDLE